MARDLTMFSSISISLVLTILYSTSVTASPIPPPLPSWQFDDFYEDYDHQSCTLANGEVYPAGSTIPSEDTCQECTCEAGPLGALIVCDYNPCDAVPREDYADYNCTLENGDVYKAGQDIPTSDTCQTCTCETGPAGALVVCVTADPQCEDSLSAKDYTNQNCTLEDGVVIKVGAEVPSQNNCETCTCEGGPLGALVVCMTRDCGVPSCIDPGYEADECCPSCPNGPSCYFGDTLLRPEDGEREMTSLGNSCGVWCLCDVRGDLSCSLQCRKT